MAAGAEFGLRGCVAGQTDGLLRCPKFFARCSLRRISSGLTLSICAARCLRKRKCLPSRFGRLPPPLAALPCGPLPLLFARFFCHRQRSQTSPFGHWDLLRKSVAGAAPRLGTAAPKKAALMGCFFWLRTTILIRFQKVSQGFISWRYGFTLH